MEKYILSEAFDSLHRQKLNESISRNKLIDLVDDVYSKCYHFDKGTEAEEIITKNNGSEDDSDPYEGFYSTMSNKDLENTYKELKALLPQITLSRLLYELRDAVGKIDDDAILDFNSMDEGFVIRTTSGDYEFTLKPVELDDNSINYTDDDFDDWK